MSFNMPRLSTEQKQEFINNGFIKIEKVVPQVLINRALRAINYSLGQGRDKDELGTLTQQSFCPELGTTDVVLDMFNKTPAFTLAEDLLGEGNVLNAPHGQVPPRFPQPLDKDVSNVKMPTGHIDGIGSGLNGIPKGEYRRGFTALCVVLLSNLPEPFMGNFTVWPKTHFAIAEHLKQNGHEVLKNGTPDIDHGCDMHMCTGEAGDVIFAHNLVLHSAAPNLSPFIRYAAIFRVRHKACEENGLATYDNMWLEYDGLTELIPQTVNH